MKKLIKAVVLRAVDFYCYFLCYINNVYFQPSAVYWEFFVYDMVFPVFFEELLYVELEL